MSQFIDGKTCDALSGQSGVVRDPCTGEVVERSLWPEPRTSTAPFRPPGTRTPTGRAPPRPIVRRC